MTGRHIGTLAAWAFFSASCSPQGGREFGSLADGGKSPGTVKPIATTKPANTDSPSSVSSGNATSTHDGGPNPEASGAGSAPAPLETSSPGALPSGAASMTSNPGNNHQDDAGEVVDPAQDASETQGGADAGDTAVVDANDAAAAPTVTAPEQPPEVVVASAQMTPTGIALDANSVYWCNIDAHTIVKCPLTGCGTGAPTPLVTNIGQALGLAVDASSFYWIEDASPSVDANVQKCPITGCTGAPEKLFTFGKVHPAFGVHVTGNTLYYASWPHLGICPTSGCLTTGPTDFANIPALAVGSNADSLFVAKSQEGVVRCPLTGCAGQINPVIAAGSVTSFAIDATHVYFAEYDYLGAGNPAILKQAVSRCPLAGCGTDDPEVVASGEISPYAIAVNATRVFYTNVAHGTIVSIAKP